MKVKNHYIFMYNDTFNFLLSVCAGKYSTSPELFLFKNSLCQMWTAWLELTDTLWHTGRKPKILSLVYVLNSAVDKYSILNNLKNITQSFPMKIATNKLRKCYRNIKLSLGIWKKWEPQLFEHRFRCFNK